MNKTYRLFILILFFVIVVKAQPAQRLTGVPDTSFTTAKDFQQSSKEYPFIAIVPDSSVAAVHELRNQVYCQAGKRDLQFDAFLPVGKQQPVPAIVLIHGGGWRSGNRSQNIPLAQHLAALGYACFTVEYRLSTEALYPAAVNDIKSAIQFLHKNSNQFMIDTNKIVALGFSAGGQLAALVGMTSGLGIFDANNCNKNISSNVNAVIDIDGTLSFVHAASWESQNKNKEGASAWWIGYPFTERADLWAAASPLTYADRNTLPFLFLNSSIDRMHVGQAEFKEMMNRKSVYTETVVFSNTPHTFSFYRPWFNDMVQAIDAFIKKIF